MIVFRDVLVRPGIIDSPRVCRLPVTCQLFFRNLLHCCDGAGRFPADAAELRSALYYRAPGVASSHVEAWLQQCAADLVKLYTRDGKRYGEILRYGQRDTKRRVIYPPEHGQIELALAPDHPPPSKPRARKNEVNRREENSPQPPAGAGGEIPSDFSDRAAKPAEAIRFRRALKLDTLREEKETLEQEITDIVRPAGRAYAQEPEDLAKRSRLELKRIRHREVCAAIEERRAELAKGDA